MSPAAVRVSALYHPLDEILGTTSGVRVARLLCEHGGELSATTIAARVGIARQSAWTALQRLEALHLVQRVGQGRSGSYRLNRGHPLAAPLETLFAAESRRSDHLFEAARVAAASLQPKPIALWLYGSAARGEDVAGSDFDLALLSAEGMAEEQEHRLAEALCPIFAQSLVRPSIIALDRSDLRKLARERDGLWLTLRRDAVPLYGPAPDQAARD